MKTCSILFFILSATVFTSLAHATTYYQSPSGSDAYSSAQAQSSSTPWKTFSKSFGSMIAGDTLMLMDGTYSVAAGTGCINHSGTGSSQPPSGTSTSNMVTIKAVNDYQAVISGTGGYSDKAVFLGRNGGPRVDYVKIEGIRTSETDGSISLYYADHCYIKNCAVNGQLSVGTIDHSYKSTYNLLEDSWVWTRDVRIDAQNYRADNTIWRRVVIRDDGCDETGCIPSGNPNVAITAYNSQNVMFQNVIIIDRIDPGQAYADFASAMHNAGYGTGDYQYNINWQGCISINSVDKGWYLEADYRAAGYTWILKNCVRASTNALHGFNIRLGEDVLAENLTSWSSSTSIRPHATLDNTNTGTRTARNIIASGSVNDPSQGYAIGSDGGNWSYVNYYGTFNLGCCDNVTVTTGALTSNPEADGTPPSLKYPVRIETGSALKGAGYGGGDYGANILYAYGKTGTFWGEAGYDLLQDGTAGQATVQLWPWTNESSMRSMMRVAYDEVSTATAERGFCADGETFTEYIWEYFGNTIPADIYGESSQSPTVGGMSAYGVSVR